MTKARRKAESKVPELWGATEVAAHLGILQTNIHKLDLPEPVATLARGRIWRADDIREWAKDRAHHRG